RRTWTPISTWRGRVGLYGRPRTRCVRSSPERHSCCATTSGQRKTEMRNELGDVRRSQIITSHGPGSILDFRAGGYGGAGISVVAAGLEEWDRWAPPPGLGHPQTVYEPRLQKQLGVDGFRLPPVAPQVAPGVHRTNAGKLVGVRFPQWLQCPRCH